MNHRTWAVKSKDVRFDGRSAPTVADRNDNVIEFDQSEANILVDDLQPVHDGGNEYEYISNDNRGTDNTNEVDIFGALVNDMGKNEGERTNKICAECERSGGHNCDVTGEWEDDNTDTKVAIYFGYLTNIPTFRRSERLTARRASNR